MLIITFRNSNTCLTIISACILFSSLVLLTFCFPSVQRPEGSWAHRHTDSTYQHSGGRGGECSCVGWLAPVITDNVPEAYFALYANLEQNWILTTMFEIFLQEIWVLPFKTISSTSAFVLNGLDVVYTDCIKIFLFIFLSFRAKQLLPTLRHPKLVLPSMKKWWVL